MANVTFKEQVTAWTTRTKERMLAVRNESVQRVIEVMQEPGPSKAGTKRAIAAGAGLGKLKKDGSRGVSKKAFGPVAPGGTGNMPVDTGFLRASLRVGKAPLSVAVRQPPENPGSYSWNASSVSLVLTRLTIEDPIEAKYTAVYARVAEYGAGGRPARRFVSLAAQQWPQIVQQVCIEARARTGGGFDQMQPRAANGRFVSDRG
ncbi:hypothetical protein HNP47_000854 [Brevundimonas vesicularis]|uniref:HK97 gp10 family phage protein n=1 Tax=Brevundimonas vesicularis TaxID=41276 RepID=A0A7W9FSR7_BREVE|nr:hypothetical protein [Brevundimonas vesicularis]MBB5770885.1 hypothetical protein [Brevundimonas vesicularis]